VKTVLVVGHFCRTAENDASDDEHAHLKESAVDTGKVSHAKAIVAVVVALAIVVGMWWRYFGPVRQGPAMNPPDTPPPQFGDPRAYPQGLPEALKKNEAAGAGVSR
jgi:hypothetical protein